MAVLSVFLQKKGPHSVHPFAALFASPFARSLLRAPIRHWVRVPTILCAHLLLHPSHLSALRRQPCNPTAGPSGLYNIAVRLWAVRCKQRRLT